MRALFFDAYRLLLTEMFFPPQFLDQRLLKQHALVLYCQCKVMNIMPQKDHRVEAFFKIVTYVLLFSVILVSLWASEWNSTLETNLLILFLIAYTLLLILPITRFKLGPSGFEGELDRLEQEKEKSPISTGTAKEVNQEIDRFSEELVEPDLVLMKLSIEIETTLRSIAEHSGISPAKVGIGRLNQMLRQKEILTDSWLLDALHFFQIHRNELIHEGKTDDIEKAIDIGRKVLTKLREIQIH